ncbi:related to GS1 protein [Cephalotrichum gorgonifer]|uniref:Related to GS1 protein n=1 Tax=Cephalotrichum gorgonifer TaxID=2041049 RepID=A0AAE8MXF9_9PEZI|nr:related to GS1 protein [Cephalotrichum gorgonifer]
MESTNLRPIRACIFDMDGLLLDTEDIATHCHNLVLEKYGKPKLPGAIKAAMMGCSGTDATQVLQNWAQLPISNAEYRQEVLVHQKDLFPTAGPLPGVEDLLRDLARAKQREPAAAADDEEDMEGGSHRIHIALATSSSSTTFKLKTDHLGDLFDVFEPDRRVLGDDPRIPRGRGKPMPDIFELALRTINDTREPGERLVIPEECLVFEDSVNGVEAARRAGMRVIWCPQAVLRDAYAGMEAQVLAGRADPSRGEGLYLVSREGDGWGEQVESLVDFPYAKYGIVVPAEEDIEGEDAVTKSLVSMTESEGPLFMAERVLAMTEAHFQIM